MVITLLGPRSECFPKLGAPFGGVPIIRITVFRGIYIYTHVYIYMYTHIYVGVPSILGKLPS